MVLAIDDLDSVSVSRQIVRRIVEDRRLAKKYNTAILEELPDGPLFLDFPLPSAFVTKRIRRVHRIRESRISYNEMFEPECRLTFAIFAPPIGKTLLQVSTCIAQGSGQLSVQSSYPGPNDLANTRARYHPVLDHVP